MHRLLPAVLLSAALASAQRGPAPPPPKDLLWPGGAPGALGDQDADKPSMTLYAPRGRKVRSAVIVCPGGSYQSLSMDREGAQVAQWLNSLGVSAFVLQYRLGPKYHHPVELGDIKRAIRIVRSRAAELGYRASQIGVMGFSAGGHLAASVSTLFDAGNTAAADPLDRLSSRPDFSVLVYPVISMTTEYVHALSRTNLLGEKPDAELARLMSSDLQVKPDTPPTFLFHTNQDRAVPAENSVLYYLALRKHGIPAEMHIYEPGGHGIALAPTDATLGTWPQRLADWMRGRGLLDAAE